MPLLLRSKGVRMLSENREIKIQGAKIAETPLVVPSFSSKGFPEVQKIIDALSPMITDSALVSAYDIFHGFVKTPPESPEFLFLDSGGYESSKDTELSDPRMQTYSDKKWEPNQLESVLDSWSARQPTMAVSYDHPSNRLPIEQQIENAITLFRKRNFGKELLIKPDTPSHDRININAVIENVHDLRHFDMIGFTEKELGYSVFDRMSKIRKIREALTSVNLKTPIHIFGSLDPISTPLYFLAGADVFDGLTWLRYSYSFGRATYIKNAAAIKHGIRINDDDIPPLMWFENYQEILNLELSMRRHIKEDRNFECFGEHALFFKKACQELLARKK